MSNARTDVFSYLANCALAVKLSTFMINDSGQVNRDVVIIHDAPPRTVSEIVSSFKHVSLRDGGLVIPLHASDNT